MMGDIEKVRMMNQTLFAIKITFKIIKRLILLVFSLLGLFSAYLLIEWEFYTSFPEETFNTLGSVLPFMICTIFVLIAYPSIIYLYRLFKKDFIQLLPISTPYHYYRTGTP